MPQDVHSEQGRHVCLTEPTAASHLKAEAEGQTLAESRDRVLSVSTTRPKLSDPASADRSNQLEHSLSDRLRLRISATENENGCQRTHWAPIESEKGCQKTIGRQPLQHLSVSGGRSKAKLMDPYRESRLSCLKENSLLSFAIHKPENSHDFALKSTVL